ncbi:methyltransferase [Candidatus Woesearchaeota archaeon]|nr:methyltransferase [Candidatus Woesearchaeota archaeon]MBN2881722.1 methyltransferase [Candidatus Woesearchaeota archaeon]
MINEYPLYEPDDDSFLLVEALETEIQALKKTRVKLSTLNILDMGAGSGVIGESALKKGLNVTFVDVNPVAIDFMNNKFSKKKNALVIQSNLFEKVPVKKFDLITFNTPYLPDDEDFHDLALHGGPSGYEVTLRFLDDVLDYLADNGTLIFLISSLTHPDIVEAQLYKLNLDYKIVGRKKLFFEELLVYRVVRR